MKERRLTTRRGAARHGAVRPGTARSGAPLLCAPIGTASVWCKVRGVSDPAIKPRSVAFRSWSIGGDESLETVVTLPNLFRRYNPNLLGFAEGHARINSVWQAYSMEKNSVKYRLVCCIFLISEWHPAGQALLCWVLCLICEVSTPIVELASDPIWLFLPIIQLC